MRVLISFVFCAFVIVAVRCENNVTATTEPATAPSNDSTPTEPVSTTPVATTPVVTTPVASTTQVPQTTTQMPVPAPKTEPTKFTYKVLGVNGSVCLLAELAVQIEMQYNNTKGHVETAYLNLLNTSKTYTSESKCGENVTTFAIMINGDNGDVLTMDLARSEKSYHVNKVSLTLDKSTIDKTMPLGPHLAKMDAVMENVTLFEAPQDKSYQCKAEETEVMDTTDGIKVTLHVKEVRIDAFRGKDTSDKFRNAKMCNADEDISDVIPIAVGAALAALVVIVLIAYFIGRRRSRRLAYQSV